MLTDLNEIELISKAIQKNVRDPKRSRVHFDNIFQDFFKEVDFKNRNYLDLGPGQFDFGVLVRERGGLTYNIDKDPAVVELGNYKKLPTIQASLQNINGNMFDVKFDGVFCKYSIDAFWFSSFEEHNHFLNEITSMIAPGGWAWIAPWNGGAKNKSDEEINRILKEQIDCFTSHGFAAFELTESLTKYYGVHGSTANSPVFCLNLKTPKRLKDVDRLGEGYVWSPSSKKIFNSKKYIKTLLRKYHQIINVFK